MHRHRSDRALRAVITSAWHYLFNVTLVSAGLVSIVVGIVLEDKPVVSAGAIAIGVGFLSIILFFIKYSSMRCPLCMGPMWGKQKCRKSKNAKRAFGVSYRLYMASSIVFKGHYRCMYCGEPFNARESREQR